MKTIYIYIIKKFIITFLVILVLFILIAIVFDFSEKIDDFIEKEAPWRAIIFDYYFNFVPYFINLFSPLFIFISAIYFTGRMASNTEFIALLASGTNFYRLLIPYMIVAAMLAGTSYWLSGWIIPAGNVNMIKFEEMYYKNKQRRSSFDIHQQIRKNEYIYMQSYNFKDSLGIRFTYEKFNNQQLIEKISAYNIKWIESKQMWVLPQYYKRIILDRQEKIILGDSLYMDLSIKPFDFGRKEMNIKTMNNEQLSEYIKIEQMRGAPLINFYKIEIYQRTSLPFATFILVLIAFAISSRKIRGGMGMNLGIGIAIAFIFIMFMQFSNIFAINGSLSPLLAVWIPNIIFFFVGIYIIRFAPK